jgi:hypothetical protein
MFLKIIESDLFDALIECEQKRAEAEARIRKLEQILTK